MGISQAFDNKVDETSFYETGVEETKYIEFKNFLNFFNYEFFSGKNNSRLPINGY